MAKSARAGRKANGNVVIDLGEKVDQRFRRAEMAGKRGRGVPSRLGSYRPGMFGYRPWFANRARESGPFSLGKMLDYPKSIETGKALTGTVLGTLGNRVLVRFIPEVVPTNSRLAVDAIAFVAGVVPFLFKRDALTVGIAIPGLVFLGGSLSDFLLDQIGLARPALAGRPGARPGAHQHAATARERLQQVQARINRQTPYSTGARPQVTAQRVGA